MSSNIIYRPNVACIVRKESHILVCQRSDAPACWQFPQGGIDKNETPEQALIRELKEEIGLFPIDYKIIEKRGFYKYEFDNNKKRDGYGGQIQTYFLVDLKCLDWKLNMEGLSGEFSDAKWILPEEYQSTWIPEFKRRVYNSVFNDFFGATCASKIFGNSID